MENQKRTVKKVVKKRKINKKRVFILVLIIFAIIFIISKIILSKKETNTNTQPEDNISGQENIDEPKYKVIKEDINYDYSGLGQQNISGRDGFFTTFSTEKTNQKIYKEYKQNGTSSWSENEYWGGTMAENGCGITTMAIVLSGYNQDYTPEYLRQKYYPSIDHDKLGAELSSVYGIKSSDFRYDTVSLSNSNIEAHLKTNRPIIICVWDKPTENRWTTTSHYMVLLATDGKGKVYVSNPNGEANTAKSSGWYDINEVTPYIAKALFIEKY